MGNKFCCQTHVVKEYTLANPETADELIKNFMNDNPSIAEVCSKPGQIYGQIQKTEIIEYDKGTYIGKVVNKKRNGLGVMLFKDQMYYEGEWNEDHFNGRGKFIFTNGDFYDGEWKNNLPEGQGLYISRNPIWRYEGHWQGGIQSGKGKQIFEDGSCYQGDFQKGVRHGKGKFRNHDGRFYEGQFANGQVHGCAQACDFTYVYEGEWKNGKIDGTGKSQWFDSQKKLETEYIGEYKNGFKNGFGEYRERDGVIYKGKWSDGYITNNGVLITNQIQQSTQQSRSK